jgi:hypothetical protein
MKVVEDARDIAGSWLVGGEVMEEVLFVGDQTSKEVSILQTYKFAPGLLDRSLLPLIEGTDALVQGALRRQLVLVAPNCSANVKGEAKVQDLADSGGAWCQWVEKGELWCREGGTGVRDRDRVHSTGENGVSLAIGGRNLCTVREDVTTDVRSRNELPAGAGWVDDGDRVVECAEGVV